MLSRFSVLVALIVFQSMVGATAAERPNFVLIFIDDMGYGDIGPFGSTLNKTPNLDRMAAEGLKMTDFYAAPVCSASRAQLLTGCYAPRVSVPGVFFPAASRGLNPEEKTIAEYLKELGYDTMCIGKWHLGDQPEFLPTRQGFDHYFGIPYSNDMQRAAFGSQERVTPLLRDEEVVELLNNEGQRRVTREYTEEAVKFIETRAATEEPFFLYFPHTAMHVPLFPHPDFVGTSDNGTYGDWVGEVDWSVGEVLAALAANGIDENTLVIFTSDNGPWAMKGKDGGNAGPLRGSKGGTMEGGVREPMIARWPGSIPAGSVSGAVSGTTDILPTLVTLADGVVDESIQIDGFDLSQVFLGEAAESARSAWHYFQGKKLKAVRSGQWKLAIAPQSLGMGIHLRPPELGKGGRLYNLATDIEERKNVAGEHPEVVSQLRGYADEMLEDMIENTRPPGRVDDPSTLYHTARRIRVPNKRSSQSAASSTINWETIQPGDAFISAVAPPVVDHSVTLSCDLSGEGSIGMLVSHGGSRLGYALYVLDDAVTLAVRHGTSVKRLSHPLAEGESHVVAEIAKNGSISLTVDDGLTSLLDIGRRFKSQPREDFCVGHDNGNRVDPRAPIDAFDGTIGHLRVSSTPAVE